MSIKRGEMTEYTQNVRLKPDYRDKLRQIANLNKRSMIKQLEVWIDQESKKITNV